MRFIPSLPPAKAEAIAGNLELLLPHEVVLLEENVHQALGIQSDLSRELGIAMSESSETFHDNAPAEAIMFDAAAHVAANREQYRAWNGSKFVVIDYPALDAQEAMIGSYVSIEMSRGNSGQMGELLGVDVVGGIRLWHDDDSEDHLVASYRSNLGNAVVGGAVGGSYNYQAGNSEITIDIKTLDHRAQFNRFEETLRTVLTDGAGPDAFRHKLIDVLMRCPPERIDNSTLQAYLPDVDLASMLSRQRDQKSAAHSQRKITASLYDQA